MLWLKVDSISISAAWKNEKKRRNNSVKFFFSHFERNVLKGSVSWVCTFWLVHLMGCYARMFNVHLLAPFKDLLCFIHDGHIIHRLTLNKCSLTYYAYIPIEECGVWYE